MEQIVQIPTLMDKARDFGRLFSMCNQTNSYAKNICFDFSRCKALRPNAVVFLGGFARLVESHGGTVVFDFKTLSKAMMKNLCQNGFAGTFGHPSLGWDGHTIPYREDRVQNVNGIMDYLTDSWIGKGWVHVSPRLRDAIAGRMWEIYSNAYEHSNTQIGVFSCGQHLFRQNKLVLSVVDFGQGIPAKIRKFAGNDDPRAQSLPASLCLKWAFTRGKSTCTGSVARGLGLDLLKEFVQLNQGKLEVYSNEGYAIIDKDGERYANRCITFDGTLVHITLRCDEKLYRFRDEAL